MRLWHDHLCWRKDNNGNWTEESKKHKVKHTVKEHKNKEMYKQETNEIETSISIPIKQLKIDE